MSKRFNAHTRTHTDTCIYVKRLAFHWKENEVAGNRTHTHTRSHTHTHMHMEPIAVLLLRFDRYAEEVLLKANTRRYIHMHMKSYCICL